MRALSADFFARHPDISFAALGAKANADALDLAPFGQGARYLPAEQHPEIIQRYRAVSLFAFPGPLALPGWVLSDLYLLPGAIGLLLCPAMRLDPAVRERLGLHPGDEAIAAAYVGAPSVTPGVFIGVSLISVVHGIHAGAWVKALTLRMMKARRVRGVTQWSSPSLRVHTRMGPLRIVGAVPGAHELRERSFVYESDLGDEALWEGWMTRRLALAPTRRIDVNDTPALGRVLDRAEAGEKIVVPPPGLDAEGQLLLREEGDLSASSNEERE